MNPEIDDEAMNTAVDGLFSDKGTGGSPHFYGIRQDDTGGEEGVPPVDAAGKISEKAEEGVPPAGKKSAGLKCSVKYQPGGKDSFITEASVELSNGILQITDNDPQVKEMLEQSGVGETLSVQMRGAKVRKVTKKRKDRPYCLRVNFPNMDERGEKKYVFDFGTEDRFHEWMRALVLAAEINPDRIENSFGTIERIFTNRDQEEEQEEEQERHVKTENPAAIDASASDLSLSGFMMKIGGLHKNWKRRWFQIDGDIGDSILYYSESREKDKSKEYKGSIDFRNVVSVDQNPEDDIGIIIVTPDRTWQLKANNKDDRDKWLNVLKKNRQEVALPPIQMDPIPPLSGSSQGNLEGVTLKFGDTVEVYSNRDRTWIPAIYMMTRDRGDIMVSHNNNTMHSYVDPKNNRSVRVASSPEFKGKTRLIADLIEKGWGPTPRASPDLRTA